MADPLLVYGATGYTGKIVVDGVLAAGLRPVLAGRNEGKLEPIASALGLEHRVFDLSEPDRIVTALRGVSVVLNVAGPFSRTARPMLDACLKSGVHYLDIAGEVAEIEALAKRHAEARSRKIMVMPAVGFDVVPSDCLAAHVVARLRNADRLTIGVRGLDLVTRGSARTLFEQAGPNVWVRRNGALVPVPSGSREREIDFGDGPKASVNVSWGDVATAYYTTGVPNVEAYFEATPLFRTILGASRSFGWLLAMAPGQVWLRTWADFFPEGPTQAERDAIEMSIVVEARDARGRRAISRMRTPQAYSFTGPSAAAVAGRVLAGDVEPGFHTPARVYGPDFVLSLDAVSREDVE